MANCVTCGKEVEGWEPLYNPETFDNVPLAPCLCDSDACCDSYYCSVKDEPVVVAFDPAKPGGGRTATMTIKDEPTITFDPSAASALADVEGFLGGVGRLCFPDGTQQFAENDTYPDVVYSPRFTEAQLEIFCKANMAHYEGYFKEYQEIMDVGEIPPPIDNFWEIKDGS